MKDNQAASSAQMDEQAQPDVSNDDQNTAEESSNTGTSSPQEKVINLAEFFCGIGNRPVFTRALFENAATQLKKAGRGEVIELLDVYGEMHRIETKHEVEAG